MRDAQPPEESGAIEVSCARILRLIYFGNGGTCSATIHRGCRRKTAPRFARLRRCDPNAGKNRHKPKDEPRSNWLAGELTGEQGGSYGIDSHGACHASGRCPLDSQHPENERDSAASHSEINATQPLPGAEAS